MKKFYLPIVFVLTLFLMRYNECFDRSYIVEIIIPEVPDFVCYGTAISTDKALKLCTCLGIYSAVLSQTNKHQEVYWFNAYEPSQLKVMSEGGKLSKVLEIQVCTYCSPSYYHEKFYDCNLGVIKSEHRFYSVHLPMQLDSPHCDAYVLSAYDKLLASPLNPLPPGNCTHIICTTSFAKKNCKKEIEDNQRIACAKTFTILNQNRVLGAPVMCNATTDVNFAGMVSGLVGYGFIMFTAFDETYLDYMKHWL